MAAVQPRYTSMAPWLLVVALVLAFTGAGFSAALDPHGVPLVVVVIAFVVLTAVIADYGFFNTTTIETDGTDLWCHCGFRARVIPLDDVASFAVEKTQRSRQGYVQLVDGQKLRVSTSFYGTSLLEFGEEIRRLAPWVAVVY